MPLLREALSLSHGLAVTLPPQENRCLEHSPQAHQIFQKLIGYAGRREGCVFLRRPNVLEPLPISSGLKLS